MIGIYKITNTADNRSYIGKSKDIKTRFRKHKYRLNKGIHHNPYSRSVICDGHVFDTMRACASYYGIKEKTMQKWLSGYRTMRE